MPAESAPMREPTYFILAALLDGPLHGYGIRKRAEELSDGRVRLAAGTLYAALDRLAEAELVAAGRRSSRAGPAATTTSPTTATGRCPPKRCGWPRRPGSSPGVAGPRSLRS